MLKMSPRGSFGNWPIERELDLRHFSNSRQRTLYLLLSLQVLNNRGELAENLVCFLVVLDLSSNKLGQVAQRLGGIQNLTYSNKPLVHKCKANVL